MIAENFENEHEMLVFVYRTTLDPKIIYLSEFLIGAFCGLKMLKTKKHKQNLNVLRLNNPENNFWQTFTVPIRFQNTFFPLMNYWQRY